MMNRNFTRANTAARALFARKQKGLTLGESLLVLGVAALIAVGAYSAYKFANSDVAANDLGRGAVTLASQIKRINGSTGYTAVNSTNVKDLVPGGWKWDGTDVIDNYGNPVSVSGGAASFALVFSNLSPQDCQKVVSQFEGISYKLHIGGASAAAGVVSGGEVYKQPNGTLNPAALSAGCGATGAVIAMEVR